MGLVAMDDTDGYDANMDPAFMTSEDELDAGQAKLKSWESTDQIARPGSLVFGDLKPSIQIEIVHNLREQLDGAIDAAYMKLKITQEENINLILYNELKRQRAALKKLDQGAAKHLVQEDLSNIFKTTCRQLSYKRLNLGAEDIMHAKASDVLLSYMFLDRLDLPRSLAGTWYNGIETRLDGHYGYPTPESESWDWAENLSKRQSDLGRFGVTLPASSQEEPRYPFVVKGSGTKSPVKQVATFTDKGKGIGSTSNAEIPFWHIHGPPTNVTDSEARYLWKLTQFEIELLQKEKALFEAEVKGTKNQAEDPHYGDCDNPEDPWHFRCR
ncbi:hypothetical protein N7476_001272 [Penicillium atrosanguineum]|uniref:Uncharacterized protein n=1 Tax=Penicillium atrosanguineum TaxID=1132637 RepID=A0A9W9UDI8_9EURO|nr:hypothetical protein N7476_001272 [Penicillium atrosanguineum]